MHTHELVDGMSRLAVMDRRGKVIGLPRTTRIGIERHAHHELLAELVLLGKDAVVGEHLEPLDGDFVECMQLLRVQARELRARGGKAGLATGKRTAVVDDVLGQMFHIHGVLLTFPRTYISIERFLRSSGQ